MKIAWIGAGKMGLPVCRRLKGAGQDVKILVRQTEQALALRELDFGVADNVPDLLREAEVIFTCVPDDQALAEVTMNGAFLAALADNAVLIDMSTVSPNVSAQIVVHLPEMNTFSRSPVLGWRASFHSARALIRSGLSCSLARRVFFEAEAAANQEL